MAANNQIYHFKNTELMYEVLSLVRTTYVRDVSSTSTYSYEFQYGGIWTFLASIRQRSSRWFHSDANNGAAGTFLRWYSLNVGVWNNYWTNTWTSIYFTVFLSLVVLKIPLSENTTKVSQYVYKGVVLRKYNYNNYLLLISSKHIE